MTFGVEELGRAIQGGVYDDVHNFDELVERLKETAYETFITVGGVYGVGAGIKGVQHYREAVRRKEQNREDLKQLVKAVQSDVVKKYSYTAQEQLRKSFEEGNDPDRRYTYFQAQDIINTLFQDDDGLKVARELGLDNESLRESLENDMPVSIETEKAATLLYANDKYKHLADAASFDPLDMSREEVEAFDSKYGDYAQEMEFAESFADDVINEATKDVDRTQTEILADSLVPDIVQTGMDEEKARHHAMIFSSFAQIIAPKLGESPESFLSRLTITGKQHFDENGKSSVYVDYGMGKRKVYGQPVNDDVNVDVPVEVVTIEPMFAGQNAKILRKHFPEDLKEQVLTAFKNGIVNEDTGKTVSMSKSDFHEHMKFGEEDIIDGSLQLEAVMALPELMRTAKLVESYDDLKNVKQIKKMHRFQGALRIGDKDYSVKLTVKEFKNGTLKIDVKEPMKLYHHRVEKELLPFTGTVERIHNQSPFGSNSNEYTLRTLLEDVKDHTKENFFINKNGTVNYKKDVDNKKDVHNQTYSQEPIRKVRGSIAFDKEADKSFITLFEDNKNMSTLLHETGHYFLNNLSAAYQMENAPQWVKDSFETLANEMGFDPKEPLSTETHERFARLAEAYFREGKAPREELTGAKEGEAWIRSLSLL